MELPEAYSTYCFRFRIVIVRIRTASKSMSTGGIFYVAWQIIAHCMPNGHVILVQKQAFAQSCSLILYSNFQVVICRYSSDGESWTMLPGEYKTGLSSSIVAENPLTSVKLTWDNFVAARYVRVYPVSVEDRACACV